MKVILPLHKIRDGHTVTKQTSQKKYTVASSIKIHGSTRKEIKAEPDVRFLVSGDGNVNAVANTLEVVIDLISDDVEFLLSEGTV